MDSFQNSVFYLDKSLMGCNMPELVVCYKENRYHVIKDICIDGGVLTKDKFLFDSGTDEKFLPSEKDLDATLMKENPEMDMSINDVSRLPEENQPDKDIDNEWGSKKKLDADTCIQDVSLLEENKDSNEGLPNQCDSRDLILSREMKHDVMMQVITDDVSKKLYALGLGELTLMSEMSSVKTQSVCSDCKSDGTEQQSSRNSSEKEVTGTHPLVSAVEESNNSSEEAILSASALVSAAEESDPEKGEATLISSVPASVSEESSSRCLVNEVSNDSRLVGGRITCHFDSSAPTSSKDECHHYPDSESKAEDRVDQPFSNNLQRENAESSFSIAGPVTGLITYSGPIAYSGNLSLRSDSSTASTRSFAFPILQPEWDASPVRMAKADRRHYRKHRGWRQGILCCRF
ncbi:Detected protein of confused Function [Hibiscus syriacus]|uniref:Detected protein of confused Function n=1 Tax=Hibiscus syriacus TaxID=106335 RepID=A0A6A3C784_HIBSY|nr:uncharacterized protein LOC120203754 [Hibiscus syriacus]KAE8724594.1 Detected protein of confused Function [Hibiscus syriacus]